MRAEYRDHNLTEGPILRTLAGFALPMMLGNLMQQIYNIADTIIVGRVVGSTALAAVGASYSLMTFLTSVMIGLCMGCSACMAMSYGAGKQEEMREKVWASFWLIGAAALLIELLVYGLENPILKLLQVPEDAFSMMQAYLRIIFAGILFTFLYNYFAFLLRAVGNSVIPLLFLGGASLLNIALDLLLVYKLGKGVEGAGAATVIAQAAAGIGLAFYVWKRGRMLLPEKEERIFRKSTISELAGYSVLTCLQQSVMNFGILMIQGLVNTFGTAVMAAFASVVKIDTIAYMPAQEFGNAYSLFISQNYGAEKKERVRIGTRRAFLASALVSTGISVLVWENAERLMRIFVTAKETEILREGVRYLHIEGAFYIGIGCLFLFYGLYRGIARPAFSLVLTIVSLGTRVLLAYVFAPQPAFGVTAIWWAILIGWFLADAVGLLYYLLKIRKKEYIYREEEADYQPVMVRQGILRTLIEAIGTVYAEAEQKGICLELASMHDKVVPHDRKETARALVYVLKNAVKYCKEGDRIEVSLTEDEYGIGIQIADSGPGIPAQDLPHIYQKRYRGRNALKKEGYGIGLYLANRIIQKENGQITCESEEGKGSLFTVFLKR